MLKDNYDIRIRGRQTYGGEEHNETGEITLSTTGSYTERGGATFIAYKEYDEDDPKIAHTAVLRGPFGGHLHQRDGFLPHPPGWAAERQIHAGY